MEELANPVSNNGSSESHLSIQFLPNEVLVFIFQKLCYQMLCTASQVCKRWQVLTSENYIWNSLLLYFFGPRCVELLKKYKPVGGSCLKDYCISAFKEFRSCNEQREKIMEAHKKNKQLVRGETRYLISKEWLHRWEKYTDFPEDKSQEQENPPELPSDQTTTPTPDCRVNAARITGCFGDGPPPMIDNSHFLDSKFSVPTVLRSCFEGVNFEAISEDEWALFLSWYDGGPEVPRRVTSTACRSNMSVEIWELNLIFLKSSDITNQVVGTFSREAKCKYVKKIMCQKMGLLENNVRVWDYHARSKIRLMDMEASLGSEQIIDSQFILLEERDRDGDWTGRSCGWGYSAESGSYTESDSEMSSSCTDSDYSSDFYSDEEFFGE